MSRSTILELELMWNLIERKLIECRNHIINLTYESIRVLIVIVSGSIIDFLENLLLLIWAKNLLNNADRKIILDLPVLKLTLKILNNSVINHFLITKSIKFSEPCFANNLTVCCCFESIFSKLEILGFILISSHGSFNCEDEIIGGVTLECVSTAGFTIPLELNNWIL